MTRLLIEDVLRPLLHVVPDVASVTANADALALLGAVRNRFVKWAHPRMPRDVAQRWSWCRKGYPRADSLRGSPSRSVQP